MSTVLGVKLLICTKLLRKSEEDLVAWEYSSDDILDEFINQDLIDLLMEKWN